MSVKETILSNLVTALEDITTFNGYSNDVAFVARKAISLSDFREDQIPLIKIFSTSEEEFLSPIGTNQRVRWKILILGGVKGSDVEEFASSFQSDMRKCLHAIDLGDNVIYTRLKEGSLDRQGKDIIMFVDMLETVYYYSESDP